jgi:hypothetical protein
MMKECPMTKDETLTPARPLAAFGFRHSPFVIRHSPEEGHATTH